MTAGLQTREFAALGGRVRISIDDAAAGWLLPGAEAMVHQLHSDLTRFDPRSELSRLNGNPRPEVEISPLMARFLEEVIVAARTSGGLVDATCIDAVERAGYRESRDFRKAPDPASPSALLPRHPAAPDGLARWAEIEVDADRGLVRRPSDLRFDSGGLGKGLAADLVAEALADTSYFSVDCGGDLRTGGRQERDLIVSVAGPVRGDPAVAELTIPSGYGVATSGITRRAWTGTKGESSHHLIDPGTGLPAFTGIVQVTAAAPTAIEAEVIAKSALLVGPEAAAGWLEFGGVVILESGRVIEVPASVVAR